MAVDIPLVEEGQAQGRVRELLRDIKRALGVPYVGDLFSALAVVPPLLEAGWWEIKPLVGTADFEGLADRVRAHALACARQHCFMPDHAHALEQRGLDKATVERLRVVAEIFYQTVPRYLVIATAIRQSLFHGPVGSTMPGNSARHGAPLMPSAATTVKLVPTDQARGAIAAIYEDAKMTYGSSFVPDELRAMAQWPDYLQLAWNDVKAQVRTAQYQRDVAAIRQIADDGVRVLPRLVRIDRTTLRGMGVEERQMSQACGMVDFFQHLLPSLVSTSALLRIGLNALLDHELLELEAGA